MSGVWYVYIMASHNRTIYTGMTGRLLQRVHEHREGTPGSFTRRYRVTKLVYFECHTHPLAAATRERQIKKWNRARRMALIERGNPFWIDLAADWFG
jgi:putative endonuclease